MAPSANTVVFSQGNVSASAKDVHHWAGERKYFSNYVPGKLHIFLIYNDLKISLLSYEYFNNWELYSAWLK